jgi:hypothetical protein
MRYKIIVGGESAEIDEDEIKRAVEMISKGGIITLRHIVFNSAYFQAIIPDHELARQDVENLRIGVKRKKGVSEFAKLLSPKMKMISDKEMTKVLEETAREERKLT